MAPAAQLSCVLFSLVSISVSSDVVRLLGDSVQLDIRGPVPEFDDLFWVFNSTNNVLEYNKKYNDIKLYSHYKDRVEFNNKTYSLTLKNVQKNDSGLYEARASAAQVKVVAEYRLSVLDPVETPVLTHQINNNTCNITLTCRGHDLSISSSCYKETCEEQEVTSPGGITLSLYVSGSSIICNHSNPVSWKKDVMEMGELKRLCADKNPVETPVLTYQINNKTCNITFTCRGHDLSINSSCYKETCEEQEVTSPVAVTLSLSVNGSSIICNHSNPVSWKEAVLEMGELKLLCVDKNEHSQQEGQLPNWLWPVVGVPAGLIILIIISIIINQRKSAGIIQQSEDIIYADVQTSSAVTTAMSPEEPSTVYSVVRKKPQPSRNGQSSQTTSDSEQMQCMGPETIYGNVSKHSRPVNAV